MEKIKDNIWIQFYFGKYNSIDKRLLICNTVAEQLIAFDFPKPILMELAPLHDYHDNSHRIQGFNDPKLHKAFKEEPFIIELVWNNNNDDIHYIFGVSSDLSFSFRVVEKYLQKVPIQKIYDFMLAILDKLPIEDIHFSFESKSSEISDYYFSYTERTSRSPNLVWLQYYGKAELERQGGEAVFDNPYIQTTRIGEGVLIQVGESPYDAYTKEGEELLVKATKAMPPLPHVIAAEKRLAEIFRKET